jgi:hypothetical protein
MVNDRLQPRSGWSSTGRVAILSSVVFLSGIGSLIFETLWLRLSDLTFGNSIWSAALILSSFMAGMALGNAFAASSRVQRWRPLQLYAFLELAIAFLGCIIVFGFPLLGEWLRPLFQTLWNYQSILLGLRFVLSFLVLLLPATAMGLTLPVFSHIFRWLCARSQKMCCLFAMAAVSQRTRLLTNPSPRWFLPNWPEPQADRYRGYFKGGIRPRDLLFWPLLFQPAARSTRDRLCSRRLPGRSISIPKNSFTS